jgi:hypothetical protein
MFVSLRRERGSKKIKTVKIVLSSSLDEVCSCSSETNNERRTAPRPELFVKKKKREETQAIDTKNYPDSKSQ